jgi:hypothetical protein
MGEKPSLVRICEFAVTVTEASDFKLFVLTLSIAKMPPLAAQSSFLAPSDVPAIADQVAIPRGRSSRRPKCRRHLHERLRLNGDQVEETTVL